MFSFGKKSEEKPEKTSAITNTLGIDLGTLNTVVAKPAGDKFDITRSHHGAVKKDTHHMSLQWVNRKMLERDIVAVNPSGRVLLRAWPRQKPSWSMQWRWVPVTLIP